jgi:protein-S-isoprenylcysteine O-methyltransferase Ste14
MTRKAKATWEKITKEQFDAAYNKYPASKYIEFAFKYFSKSTEKKDMAISNVVIYILLGLFAVGFFGTALSASRKLIAISTIIYSIFLAVLVFYLFSAVKLNNIRINKIRKELGVSREEYDALINKYYS